MITNSRQQVEAQAEPFAPVAVAFTQDAKHLEPRQHMLHNHPLPRQGFILHFLLRCERMMLAFLVRRLTVAMPPLDSSITRIGHTTALLAQPQSALLKQSKVMHVSCTKSCSQNASTALLYYHLNLQGVPLLLAAEERFAFFCAPLPCGCSMGHSVASITTTCHTVSAGRKAFLPGKWNCPERIRASSTLRTVREAVASLIWYVLAMWKSVRYSRQYISVNSNWSHKGSLVGRPKLRICSSKALSIASKVSRRTPVSRRNSSGLRCCICS